MAYSDYGAFVWCNGERRTDKEDAAVYESLLHQKNDKENDFNIKWLRRPHHGVMGDDDIRVVCHKQGLPGIWERTNDSFKSIKYLNEDTSFYSYGRIYFEYKGYHFEFKSSNPYDDGSHYIATMIEPDGTFWECEYDYMYGAGFEEEI